jgi:23S rRNA (cytidine1920-2'-O)/16S rRNA (cytidine1409-2'-O)-methyltransferase
VQKPGKARLDVLLVQRGLAESRERARALIMAGAVLVDGRLTTKPGATVPETAQVSVRESLPYVSRGALKLAHALAVFGIDASGRVCLDVGASTGGFTQVLLERGAARVYAVDVGYGQLDWRLRTDPRVVVMERVNVRFLRELPEPIDLATVDVSFISLRLAIPPIVPLLRPRGEIVALIKPQFEAGRERVQRGGVVRDPTVHEEVLRAFLHWSLDVGIAVRGLTPSPIKGPAGNVEFLAHLVPDGQPLPADALVTACMAETRRLFPPRHASSKATGSPEMLYNPHEE